jgi:hypothetical protein
MELLAAYCAIDAAIASGGAVDTSAIERTMREAAMADAARLYCMLLSSIEPAAPLCPVCGHEMQSLGRREKDVVSLMGAGTVSRRYYGCKRCRHHAAPLDVLAGIDKTSYTPNVRSGVSVLASAGPFEWTSAVLADIAGVAVSSKQVQRISESVGTDIESKRLALRQDAAAGSLVPAEGATRPSVDATMYIEYDGTGVPMCVSEVAGRAGRQEDGSAKTREVKLGCVFTQTGKDDDGNPIRDPDSTSYFGAIETAGEFSGRAYAEAVLRGLGTYWRTAVIGDGARWIWNLADTAFPGAVQIVDAYHAKEHVCKLAHAATGGKDGLKEARARLLGLLDAGDIEGLVSTARSMAGGSDEATDAVDAETGYFIANAERMRYADFREAGLFIGSGVIEAGCKSVIGQRLKQSGMFWTTEGANAIAALRCRELSGKNARPVLVPACAA